MVIRLLERGIIIMVVMALPFVFVVAMAALAFAWFNFFEVKKLPEGNKKMQEIAAAIRLGADAFIKYEYKVLLIIGLIIAVFLAILVSIDTGIAFILGASMSASAGWVGMKIATYANVRVANEAKKSKKISSTLKVAFQGGSVMGLCVGGFALLGLFIVFLVFGVGFRQLAVENIVTVSNWLGVRFVPFTMTISGYALGCSVIAMFDRVGGGIYTKAADMGADLVGKTEAHIPEDDPRNPATIADNVGDNVGDVAGLGADLLESYVGAIISAVVLGCYLYLSSTALNSGITDNLLQRLFVYPLLFATFGLLACMFGIWYLIYRKQISENPHAELNNATWMSAGLTLFLTLIVTLVVFSGVSLKGMSFRFGIISPWLASAIGIAAGIIIGLLAEYYTSYDYKPTQTIAKAANEGAALTITQGLAVGMKSCMAPLLTLGGAIVLSYYFAGMYGVAMGAVGMLSFVAATVSVDTYGPISDNSGGIAEMSKLDPEVRKITDKLDAVGNTTAAIGKGFAIGSAAFATLSLMVSYLYSYTEAGRSIVLDLINPLALSGALIGAALPFMFSGLLIEAVAKTAAKMVDEVRRQFREIPGILSGKGKPDYKTCIEISSHGALSEMRLPAILSIVFPIVSGFLFGPNFVGGVLIGSTLSAIMLAIFCGNAGGAWDNAKKYIEAGGLEGATKGSAAHDAAVVGDTVGDPLKDTVGPSLDILIKIMSIVSLIAVSIFSQYNLLDFISALFK